MEKNYFYSVSRQIFLLVTFVLAVAVIAKICQNHLDYLEREALVQEAISSKYATTAQVTKQLDCLTRNIYFEAGYEPFEGKVAVAQVTMNRVSSGHFPDSVCGVVYQKNIFYQKVVCQFSWSCQTNHSVKPINPAMYRESQEVARKVMLENFKLPGLKNAMYYHADYVNPGWKLPKISKIGRHIFYGERT